MAVLPDIIPHTTRASGTVLTATIYNKDHEDHVSNVETLVDYINEFVVGIIFRGTWDPAVQYAAGDMVLRSTLLYVASADSLGEDPDLGSPWHTTDAALGPMQAELDAHEGRITAVEAADIIRDALDTTQNSRLTGLESNPIIFSIAQAPFNATTGSSDNTAAINACIAAAIAAGLMVYVPPGNFTVLGNLADFHTVEDIFWGPGTITRGTDTWHVSPLEGTTNKLYVNFGTGSDTNDGLTAALPHKTAQQMIDAFINRRTRKGSCRLVLTGQSTDQQLNFTGWIGRDDDFFVDGAAVSINVEPTTKINGERFGDIADPLYNAATNGITINKVGDIRFSNIEVAGFPNANWLGIRSSIFYTNCWADGINKSQKGFYHRMFTSWDHLGGKTRRHTQYGWLELWHVTRNTAQGDPDLGTMHTVELNALGHKAKELCTGHGDGTLYQDNDMDLVFSRCCTMNASKCKFYRATHAGKAPICLYNCSSLVAPMTGANAVDFALSVGNPNKCVNDTPFDFDSTSGFTISEIEDPGLIDRITNRVERLLALAQEAVPAVRNNTTVSTLADLNSLSPGTLRRRGQYIHAWASGTKTGANGPLNISVAIDGAAQQTIAVPAAATEWEVHFDISSQGLFAQLIKGNARHNANAIEPFGRATTTLPIGDENAHTLVLQYQCTAGDSLTRDWSRASTTDKLNSIAGDDAV